MSKYTQAELDAVWREFEDKGALRLTWTSVCAALLDARAELAEAQLDRDNARRLNDAMQESLIGTRRQRDTYYAAVQERDGWLSKQTAKLEAVEALGVRFRADGTVLTTPWPSQSEFDALMIENERLEAKLGRVREQAASWVCTNGRQGASRELLAILDAPGASSANIPAPKPAESQNIGSPKTRVVKREVVLYRGNGDEHDHIAETEWFEENERAEWEIARATVRFEVRVEEQKACARIDEDGDVNLYEPGSKFCFHSLIKSDARALRDALVALEGLDDDE